MRAVLVDPGAPGHLKLTEAPEPVPLSDQAIVEVKAISLNLGEVKRARRSEAGLQLGWDLAGIVAEPAADGSGPPAGTRVVAIVWAGAWAERAAVMTSQMAPLPDGVSFADAATLPVAGMTALYALEQGGQLLGRRVLVTGASGGVGLFGIQLAKLSGATVTALIRQEKYTDLVAEAGAAHVVVGERAQGVAQHGSFHCTLESVGGQVLADAMQSVAADGVLVNYGVSAGEQATIEVGLFFRTGRARYYGLFLFTEFGRRPASDGLGVLVDLLAAGKLDGHIAAEGGLDELGDLAERLFNREIAGKAVIHLP
jgi:NADPH:quinone reductase-like Zn-dependent oxidoreductase